MAKSMEALTKSDWPQVGLIFVIGLFAAAQFGKVALVLPSMGEEYGLSDPVLALAISAVSVAGLVFGTLSGWGTGRYGAKRVLIWALTAAGALSIAQATMPAFGGLIVLRLLEGLAHLSIVVSAPVLMARASSDAVRSFCMALWASFFGVSLAISSQIFPGIIAAWGVSGLWMGHGFGLLLLAFLATKLVTPIRPRPEPFPGFLSIHREIYSSIARMTPGLGFFWHTLIFLALLTFLPLHASGNWSVATTASAFSIASLVGIFLAGFLARWIPVTTLLSVSYLASIVALGVLLFAPEELRPILGCLTLVCVGATPGAAFAAIPALNTEPDAQAHAGGALAQLGNLGTGSGSPIFAMAMVSFGFSGIVGLAIAISVTGYLCTKWATRTLHTS